jgi:hypothetical protein
MKEERVAWIPAYKLGQMSMSVVDEIIAFGVGELPLFDFAPVSDMETFVEPRKGG